MRVELAIMQDEIHYLSRSDELHSLIQIWSATHTIQTPINISFMNLLSLLIESYY